MIAGVEVSVQEEGGGGGVIEVKSSSAGGGGGYLQFRRPSGGGGYLSPTKSNKVKNVQNLPDVIKVWSLTQVVW